MSWKRRLAELAAAGGLAAASTGCPAVIPGGTCNANPDPCCSQPDGPVCQAQMECLAAPTVTCCQSVHSFESDCVPRTCDPLAADPCGDPATGCFGSSFSEAGGNLYFSTMPQTFQCDVTPSSDGCAAGQISGFVDGTTHCFSLCAPGETYLGNAGTQQPRGVAPHECGATESCVYSWRFEVDSSGALHRSPTSDTVGICIDHSTIQYDSNHDGFVDTPWPTCESQPIHRDPSSTVPDATMMGCVASTTAGL